PAASGLDVRFEPKHLGGVPPHLLDIVRLDVDEAERRPLGRRETLLELIERGAERQLDRLEAPALVDRARLAVRREHLELEHLHSLLAESSRDLANELGREAAPSRL